MKRLASRKDSRVIDLMIAFGPLGYGIYALLVDYLKERKAFRSIDDINRIAYELHADAETVRAVITDFNLFEIIEGEITLKNIERKAPAVEEVIAAAPETEVSSPVSCSVVTSSRKRRERRKRLRFMETKVPVFLQRQE